MIVNITKEMESVKIKKIFIILIILIFFVLCGLGGYHLVLKYLYPLKYSDFVYIYSEKYNIEPAWVFAIIKAESNFKEDIVSRKRSHRPYADYGKHSKRNCN